MTVGGVVLAVAFGWSLRPGAVGAEYVAAGRPQPLPEEHLASVRLADFDGFMVGLRGRPVVVNVWASWCAPCRAEMPLLERAAKSFAGRVQFLGVASKDDAGPAESFLRDVGVTYPNVLDVTGGIRRALGMRAFPTTYVFDARGRQVTAVVGGISESRLAAQLDELVD